MNRATLRFVLALCDIPLDRMDLSDDNNLRWVQRNIRFNNDGEKVDIALSLIEKILAGEE
jgi:hypothetical protein